VLVVRAGAAAPRAVCGLSCYLTLPDILRYPTALIFRSIYSSSITRDGRQDPPHRPPATIAARSGLTSGQLTSSRDIKKAPHRSGSLSAWQTATQLRDKQIYGSDIDDDVDAILEAMDKFTPWHLDARLVAARYDRGMRRRAVLAIAVGMLALAGCGGPNLPAPPSSSESLTVGSEQTPSAEPSAVPTAPSSTPTAETLPASTWECNELLSTAWLRDHIDERLEDPREFGTFTDDGLPGPVAQKAFESARVLRFCGWGIPESDGGFSLTVLSIEPAAQETLIGAMAGSRLYTRRIEYTNPIYSRFLDDGIGWGFAQGFAAGYWIVSQGTMIDPDTASEFVYMALEAATSAVR